MKIYLTDYAYACQTETELLDDVTYPQRVHWFPDTFSRVSTGMFYAPHRVAERVLLKSVIDRVKSTPSKKTAFILASGNAHFAGIGQNKVYNSRLTYKYKFMPLTLTNIYAGRIARYFGDIDYVATDATACASSLKVMMDVQTLIQMYGYQRVIVLAVEDQINDAILDFFGETGASLTADKEGTPSAFDSRNEGFYIGQGACLAVFEDEPSDDAKAMMVGAYTASEGCTNALGQREDGQGFVNAIVGATSIGNINLSEVRTIKTHGTGTKSNNLAERTALNTIMKTPFVATSYKQRIGHTMGVSGLLETLLLLDSIKADGTVPEILNRTEQDKTFLSEPAEYKDGYILSLAAGMGNVYSAALFKPLGL